MQVASSNITANDIKFFNSTGQLNSTNIKALKSACDALKGLGLNDPSHCPPEENNTDETQEKANCESQEQTLLNLPTNTIAQVRPALTGALYPK